MGILELTPKLQCPIEGCQKFGKFVKLGITERNVNVQMTCELHLKTWKSVFSINQFVKLANKGLVLPEDIADFQKKFFLKKGYPISVEGGFDWAHGIPRNQKSLVIDAGEPLFCKCGDLYSLTLDQFKAKKGQLNIRFRGYCSVCEPKGKKKIDIPYDVFQLLSSVNVIDDSLAKKVKNKISAEEEDFNPNEMYGIAKSILSPSAQEALGIGREKTVNKCYVCGNICPDNATECPECGYDL